MWFIGVEVEQETSAPPPKKNPGSALALLNLMKTKYAKLVTELLYRNQILISRDITKLIIFRKQSDGQ